MNKMVSNGAASSCSKNVNVQSEGMEENIHASSVGEKTEYLPTFPGDASDWPVLSWSDFVNALCERQRVERRKCESEGLDYESRNWSKLTYTCSDFEDGDEDRGEDVVAFSRALDDENREVFQRLIMQWRRPGLEEQDEVEPWTWYSQANFFRDISDELRIGKEIGKGGQATIYEAHFRNDTGVLKVFHRGYKLADLERQWPEPFLIARSGKVTYTLEYAAEDDGTENDATEYDTTVRDFGRRCSGLICGTLLKDGRFAFLMDAYCCDVRKLIDLQNLQDPYLELPPFQDAVAIAYILQIAKGMRALHALDIVHRDLKAANVLTISSGLAVYSPGYNPDTYDLTCYVSDYETSASIFGTIGWMAPEVLRPFNGLEPGQIMKSETWTRQTDVYSFGLTCYEILTGVEFDEKFAEEFTAAGRTPPFPEYVHRDLQKLLKLCWHNNPLKRPTFEQIVLQLEEFQKVHGELPELPAQQLQEIVYSGKE